MDSNAPNQLPTPDQAVSGNTDFVGNLSQTQPSQAQPQQPAPSGQNPSATNSPNPQQPQQQQPSLRSRIFDTILKAGAGTPVQDANGQPIPMTRGIMGKAIIANALAGMMAGYGTSETVDTKQGLVRVNNPAKAFAAGGQAGAQQQDQRQKAVDDASARAYMNVKRNLDLATQQQTLSTMALHHADLYNDILDKQIATNQPYLDGLKDYDDNREPTQQPAILARNMSYEDAMKKFGYNVVQHGALLDGKVAVHNPQTGGTDFHQTYTIIDPNVKPSIPAETLKTLSDYGVSGYSQLAERKPDGVEAGIVPIGQVQDALHQAHGLITAQNFLNHAMNDVYKSQGGSGSASVDLKQAVKSDPSLRSVFKDKNVQQALASGQPVYRVLDAIRNAPNGGKLINVLDDPDNIDKYITAKQNEATEEQAKAKVAGQQVIKKQQEDAILNREENVLAYKKSLGGNDSTPKPIPDSLGVTITPPSGGSKGYDKVKASFKKDADNLARTEGTYNQFQDVLNDINAGKDLTGAQSVVSLFNAIGLSAEPLQGKGFRINHSTVEEHEKARGLGENLYQKLLKIKDGDVITPQQIKDYANIAINSRHEAYVNKINEARGQGLDPSFLLPRGNGRPIDPNTVKIFLDSANGSKEAARKAAQDMGWKF
jgi:hypothetical protein